MSHTIKKIDSYDLKKNWSKRLGKLYIKNKENYLFNIGKNHIDFEFRLTQLAIKYKI